MTVFDEGKEIGVSAISSERFGPRRAPGKDESALDRSVEGRGMGFAVVVVVNGKSTDVVTASRKGDIVAILLTGGEWEVTESLFVLKMEM